MKASLASLTRDEVTASAADRPNQQDVAAQGSSTAFDREIAAAGQVLADGLAEMWAARRDPVTLQRESGASDKRALIASLTDRADVLALRALAAAAQPGTASSFSQAGKLIRNLAVRRLGTAPVNASGRTS